MNGKELERAIDEVWSLFKETDERFKETDKRFKETAERFEKTDKEIDKLTKNIGGLAGKWGKFVEGLVAPGAVRMFKERGIEVEKISRRVEKQKNGKKMEIDLLVENQKYVLVIEVKITLNVEEINEHLKVLQKFKQFFPEFKGRKVVGAVAGIVIDEGADKYAYRKGLFIIGQTGESVNILNEDGFEPKLW